MNKKILSFVTTIGIMLGLVNFAPAEWNLVYQTDFSSDPGWITNNPANYYWDSANQEYYVKSVNSSNEWSVKQVPYDGGSFKIEYDCKMTQNDWASGLNFGLFDEDKSYHDTTDGTTPNTNAVNVECTNPDSGRGFTLYAINSDRSNWPSNGYITNFVGFNLGTWYHIVIEHNAPAHTVSYIVTVRDTGAFVCSGSLSNIGNFSPNMNLVGVSRKYIVYATGNTTIAKIDNVKFYTTASPVFELTKKISLSNNPRGICYDPVYNKTYVACWKDGSEYIYVINANDYTIETTITTQLDNHGAIVVSPDGRYIYTTNYYGGSVTRFDITNNYSKTTLSLGSWANEMRISADGSKLYVVLGTDGRVWIEDTGSKIAIIDTTNFTTSGVEYINLPEATYGETHELVLSPDNTRLYVTALKSNGSTWYQKWIHTISLTTKSVINSVEGYGGTTTGRIMDITSNGQLLYISNEVNNKIDVLNTSDLSFQYSISVGNKPSVIEITPDDKYAVVFTSPSVVSVVDLNNKSVVQTIPGFTGAFDDGDIIFDQTGNFAYGINCDNPGSFFVLKKATITIMNTGTLSGKVTKSDGTTGISGALVEVLQSGIVKSSTTSDSSGNYSLTLSTGTYYMFVSTSGYVTGITTGVVVNAGQPITINYSLQSTSWVTVGKMNYPRYNSSSVVLNDGKILIIGGYTNTGPTNTVEIFNPVDNTFTLTTSMNTKRYSHMAIKLLDGRVLVTGGSDGNSNLSSCEIYNPVNQTWTSVADTNQQSANSTLILLNDGKIIRVSGSSGGWGTNQNEIYDPDLNTWNYTGDSIENHCSPHGAAKLNNGNIIAAGGYNFNSKVEVYISTAGFWMNVGDLPQPVHGVGIGVIDDKAIIAGGNLWSGQHNTFKFTYIYNSTLNNLTRVADMLTSRETQNYLYNIGSGKVLAIGGFWADGTGNHRTLNECEQYDINTNTWTVFSPMTIGRLRYTSNKIGNKIYVFGGAIYSPDGNHIILNTAEYVTIDENIQQTGIISGKVTKSDGVTAIGGVMVELLDSGIVKSSTTTDTSGNYSITIATGTYDVRASASGYAVKQVSGVVVTAAQTTMVDFTLLPAGTYALGDKKWLKYVKSGVYEDPDTYIPKISDIGVLEGTVDDTDTFHNREIAYEDSVVAYKTYVYVSQAKDLNIGVVGDDGVAIYVNGNFVAGRGNAEDPMSFGVMHFDPGWNEVVALVYNGPACISLKFDKVLSLHVEEMWSVIPSTTGTISGKVTKSDGVTGISGALVEVLQSGVVKSSTTTDTNGNYSLTVATGTYDVRASSSGYITKTSTGIVVNTGQITTVNPFVLSLMVETQTGTGWRYPRVDRIGSGYYPSSSTVQTTGAFQQKWSVSGAGDVLTADVDGDGYLEIVTITGNVLKIIGYNGVEKKSITLSPPGNSNARLRMLADVNGDGIDDIGIGTGYPCPNSGSNLTLKIWFYDGQGTLLKTFTRLNNGNDSYMAPAAVTSNGDILVELQSGYACDPRGYARYSWSTGNELWYYDVGPAHGVSSVNDFNNDGKLELANSAATVHNGASGSGYNGNGTYTTDDDFWTIIVDEDGNQKFSVDYRGDGQSDGDVVNYFVDLNKDGVKEILAVEDHGENIYLGTSQLHLINQTGQIYNTFNGKQNTSWPGVVIADINNDGKDEVIATNGYSSQTQYIFDYNLNMLSSYTISGFVSAVNDIDGDGNKEIILRDVSTVRVLDKNLHEKWNYVLPANISEIRISDLDKNGRNELIAVADKIYVLEGTSIIQTGTISGKVTKSDGTTGIQGALVEALQSGVVKSSTTTDSNGNYSLTLSTGNYDVKVTATGYPVYVRPNQTVYTSSSTIINFALTQSTNVKEVISIPYNISRTNWPVVWNTTKGEMYLPVGDENGPIVISTGDTITIKRFLGIVSNTNVDLSADGTYLFARAHYGDWDEGVRVFDTTNWNVLYDYHHNSQCPWTVLVSSVSNNIVYMTQYYGGSVIKVNVVTGTILKTISVGSWPCGMIFDKNRRYLYVGQGDPGTGWTSNVSIKVIDTQSDTVVGTIPLNGEPGVCLVVSPDNNYLYVVTRNTNSERLYKISTGSYTIISTLDIPGVGNAGVCISPDGTKLYITYESANLIQIINTVNMTQTGTISINSPANISVSPDGKYALIVNQKDDVLYWYSLQSTTITVTGSITGIVTKADGVTPISGARVDVYRTGEIASLTFATTDTNGNYSLTLSTGIYDIKISAAGYQTQTLERIKIVVGETNQLNFALNPAGTTSKPDLIIESLKASTTSPVKGQNISITIVIKNQGNVSASSFFLDFYKNLSLSPALTQPGDKYWQISSLASNATSTFTYTFVFNGGEINSYAQIDTDGDISESNENNNVKGPLNIKEPAGTGIVSGKIYSKVDGKPIFSATISIKQSGEEKGSTTSKLDGSYSFGIAEGTYTIEVSADGYASTSTIVNVYKGQTISKSFYLSLPAPTEGIIYGRVTTQDGVTAIPNTSIKLYQGTNLIKEDFTTYLGDYRLITGSGTYTIKIEATGYRSAQKDVIVLQGQGIEINFQLAFNITPPEPVADLIATALDNSAAALDWTPSVSGEVEYYNVYYTQAPVDMSNLITELFSSVKDTVQGRYSSHWVSPYLTRGEKYYFSVRPVAKIQGQYVENLDINNIVSVSIIEQVYGVKARIKIPQTGKKISGNMVLVMAEAYQNPTAVKEIKFEYKASYETEWQQILPATERHPNPDNSWPYFIHWDVTTLPDGNYNIRAIAYDLLGGYDTQPDFVTVSVNKVDKDIDENTTNGEYSKKEKIDNRKNNTVRASGTEEENLTEVIISTGALISTTDYVKIVTKPAIKTKYNKTSNPMRTMAGEQLISGPLAGLAKIVEARQVSLESGQKQLLADAEISIPYEDKNNDGIEDTTQTKVEELELWSKQEGDNWEKENKVEIDTINKKIKVTTKTLTTFAVISLTATNLADVSVYPNPVKVKEGHDRVTFAELTGKDVTIKIFNIAGELVFKKENITSGSYDWLLVNENNEVVSGGIYIYLITDKDGNKITGKFGIIR